MISWEDLNHRKATFGAPTTKQKLRLLPTSKLSILAISVVLYLDEFRNNFRGQFCSFCYHTSVRINLAYIARLCQIRRSSRQGAVIIYDALHEATVALPTHLRDPALVDPLPGPPKFKLLLISDRGNGSPQLSGRGTDAVLPTEDRAKQHSVVNSKRLEVYLEPVALHGLHLLHPLDSIGLQHLRLSKQNYHGHRRGKRIAQRRDVYLGPKRLPAVRPGPPPQEGDGQEVGAPVRAVRINGVGAQGRERVDPGGDQEGTARTALIREAQPTPKRLEVTQQRDHEVPARAVANEDDLRRRQAQGARQVQVGRQGVLQGGGERVGAAVARQAVGDGEHRIEAGLLEERLREESVVAGPAVPQHEGAAVQVQRDLEPRCA